MTTFGEVNNQLWSYRAGFWSLVALYLVSFFSKAGVNFFAAFCYVIAIYIITRHDRNLFRREPLLLLSFIPLLFGLMVSGVSHEAGWGGMTAYLNEFKFFFLPFIFSVLLRDQRRVEWLYLAMLASAVIVIVYGFSQKEQQVFGMFHGYFVYPDVRTSQMIMVVAIASIVFVDDQEFRKRNPKVALVIVLFVPVFIFSLYMGSIRSTWLGFALAIFCYSALYRPIWLIPMVLSGGVMLFIGQENDLSKELASVLNFRGNSSNNTRLQLWAAGWDFSEKSFFLGVGSNGIQQKFIEFYNAQSVSYKASFSLVSSSIGNFHNSYMQILVEWGVLTLSIFILSGFVLIYKLFQALKTVAPEHSVFIKSFLIVSVAYLFSQFFHNELLSYSATLYFLLMYGAIYVASTSNVGNHGRIDE